MALNFFGQLYSLDTLDTRFIIPASAPPREALEEAKLDPTGSLPGLNGRSKGRSSGDAIQPSRWNTTEFYVYYVVVALSVLSMFKLVLDASNGHTPVDWVRITLIKLRITSKL